MVLTGRSSRKRYSIKHQWKIFIYLTYRLVLAQCQLLLSKKEKNIYVYHFNMGVYYLFKTRCSLSIFFYCYFCYYYYHSVPDSLMFYNFVALVNNDVEIYLC